MVKYLYNTTITENEVIYMAIKQRKRRAPKNLAIDHIGHLPDWSTIESHEDEKFNQMFHDALRHYGYFYNHKDLKKNLVKWLEKEKVIKPTKIKAFKKSLDWRTPTTAGSLGAMALAGMPMSPRVKEYIVDCINSAIKHNEEDGVELVANPKDKKKAAKKPSIQDRITAKINEHILHYEEAYEDGIVERKEKHPKPDILSYARTEQVPASMVPRIIEYFQIQWDELKGSQGVKADPDLKEAYAHLKKADVKRRTDFYKAITSDLAMYYEEKKVARKPRTRKPQPKGKQVAKLQYMKSFDALKLVSINPTDIIDAKVLWVYNTKTRKFGAYKATGYDSLSVKGTTIKGFATTESKCKTLRKPKEQLAEFKKAGKVKLRTFMDGVKAVEIKLTGRITKDVILLKAY